MLLKPVTCLGTCLLAFGATAWKFTEYAATLPTQNPPLKALPALLVRPADNAEYYCTTSSDWRTRGWDPADCLGAVQKVLNIELEPKHNTVYEFLETGAPQSHPHYYGQTTPRQYVFESCTLSIVMMNDSRLGNITPAKDLHNANKNTTFAASDFTTYTDIWYAFMQIYRLCAYEYQVPGWIPIGDDSSVGIFLHATNSTIDRRINATNATEPDKRIADSVPNGWAYLGCNFDLPYRHALDNLSWAGENLNIGRCAEYCDEFDYFGVEHGEECYCGDNSFYSYTAIGGESACNTTCNGNDTQICGGVEALSVYFHTHAGPYVPTWGVNNG